MKAYRIKYTQEDGTHEVYIVVADSRSQAFSLLEDIPETVDTISAEMLGEVLAIQDNPFVDTPGS